MPRFFPLHLCQALLLVILLPAAPQLARADLSPPTKPEAKSRLDEANNLYRLGKFNEAAAAYEAGALIEPKPVFLYNLGQCHRQLGNYDKAIWFYSRFLDAGDVDDEVAMYVRDFIKVMKGKKEQELKDKPPVEPSGDGEAQQQALPKLIKDKPELASAWYDDKLGWALTGLGLAFGGAAAGFTVSASGLDSDANAESNLVRRKNLSEKADSRRVTATVLGITGAAVFVSGIVRLVLHDDDERKMRITARVDDSTLGVVFAGRF